MFVLGKVVDKVTGWTDMQSKQERGVLCAVSLSPSLICLLLSALFFFFSSGAAVIPLAQLRCCSLCASE